MKNNLLFCENCNELTENNVCPKCGAPTRAPQDKDMCFVEELGGLGKSMYADALSNSDVPFVAMPIHEGFSRMNTPVGYKIYVRYDNYDKATEILNTIFSDQDAPQEVNFDDPASAIDRLVRVVVERPLGSVHPEHPDIKYGLNYGYVEGVMGGDGEEQDAYLIGYHNPLDVGKEVDGYVIAVIVRKNDVETKWVVAPYLPYVKESYTKEEIAKAVNFQEKFFDIEIIM